MHSISSFREPHLLAVIVTAHNLEHYIGECLTSIALQSSDEIEIIVIDDGSTDLTAMQVETAMRAYPECSIRLISQENRGVSEARNRGIAEAHARYIAFVDGDDLWAPDFCEHVLPVLRDGHVDMVEFDVEVVSDAGVPVDAIALVPPGSVGAYPVDAAVLRDFVDTYQAFVWARVYRATLWRNVRFPSGRHYEDNATLPYLYLLAHTVYRIGQRLYCYRRRSGSITSIATLSTVRDLALNAEEALVRSGDTAYGEFWRGLFEKSFKHACSQVARVDVVSYPEAMQIVDDLAQRYRVGQTARGTESADHAIEAYAWHVRLERGVFRCKRALKRLLGREMQARPRLPPTDSVRRTAATLRQ